MQWFYDFVGWANGWLWGIGMLVLIGGTGIIFSICLGFFQITHHGDMWKRIFSGGSSDSGISTFASFCTTMAMRIGTDNVAGVAVAIWRGGPGAIFWMWVIGITNAAVNFVECTLGQLYKRKVDGEYRGSCAMIAEYGWGQKWYGYIIALSLGLGAGLFMPAAATNTISDSFLNAAGIPMWVTSLILALILGAIIIGGIKRIGAFASAVVPFMTVAYAIMTIIIVFMNLDQIPRMFGMIFSGAFGKDAIVGGAIGTAIQQGIKRGTFSSASGMGEAVPAASASETSHPVKQGLANAAGVFLDTIVVCTMTAFMVLLTNCFNVSPSGETAEMIYKGSEAVAGQGGGVGFVQAACNTFINGFGNWFVAIMLLLFSFTCIVSYYYEAETSLLYLIQGEDKAKARKTFQWILKIVMIILVFIYGIVPAASAWDIADFALGFVTWVNVIMLWFVCPKAFALYKDYRAQMKAGQDPYYDPNKLCWKGVDKDLWCEINKDRIAAGK